MKKFASIYLLLFLLLLSACTKNDNNVFPVPPSERMEQALIDYRDFLADSEHGWLMEYTPGPQQQYGSFSFIMKFTTKGFVNVYAEKALSAKHDPTKPVTSLYALKKDQGAVLSFDNFNPLFHFFSSPDYTESGEKRGKGFEGDYEFLFKDLPNQLSDTLLFLGKKTRNKMRLIKLKESKIDYLKDINEADRIYSKAFGKLMTFDGKYVKAIFPYNVFKRGFSFTNSDASRVTGTFLLTDQLMKFAKPINVEGQSYSELIFDKEKRTFASKDGRVKIESVEHGPMALANKPWVLYFDSTGMASPAVVDLYNKVNAVHMKSKNAEHIFYPYLVFNRNNISAPLGKYSATHDIHWAPYFDKQVLIYPQGAGNSNWQLLPHYKSLLTFFVENAPYKGEKDHKDLVKFTSVNNPDVWFRLDRYR